MKLVWLPAVATHGTALVAKIAGVDDREAAVKLKGMDVAVPRDAFPPAGENEYYLGREMGRRTEYSEHTAEEIDAEVKRIIDEAYARAKRIIDDHRDKLEAIAKALLEYETLEGAQVGLDRLHDLGRRDADARVLAGVVERDHAGDAAQETLGVVDALAANDAAHRHGA